MAALISQGAIRLILRLSSRLPGSRQIESLASAGGTFFGSLLAFLTNVRGDFLRAEPNLDFLAASCGSEEFHVGLI